MDNLNIGLQIKSLRKSYGMTLKQLSEETDLSIGFLSQLERGLSTVAVDSLSRIANALKVDLSYFFTNNNAMDEDPILRSYKQNNIEVNPQIIESILSNEPSEYAFLARIFLLLPHEKQIKKQIMETYTHEGDELIYILEGILTLILGGKEYAMYPGDSVQLHSKQPHNWENRTNQAVKFLQINCPNPYLKTDRYDLQESLHEK